MTEDRGGADARDDVGDLWSWGAGASRAMSERVITLYSALRSPTTRVGTGDLEDELANVRLDIDRLLDLSLDVFDRFFAVVSSVVEGAASGPTTPGELLGLRAAPGDTASADMWVHNSSNEEHAAPRLRLPGLSTVDGACIPPSGIRISASAAPIDGNNSRRVTLVIDVPADARCGSYYGALIADSAVESALLVRLEVDSAAPRVGESGQE